MKDASHKTNRSVQFGCRRPVPVVCVVDSKPHIRTFLTTTLEDLGFITRQCSRMSEVIDALSDAAPDIFVVGLLSPESAVTETIRSLATKRFKGKVMLYGAGASLTLMALHEFGEGLGLDMLPPLRTPFRDSDLRDNLSGFLPIRQPPSVPVDITEALDNGWLELWYQPSVDLSLMSMRGVEAVTRLRHPSWGVVTPVCLLQSDNDPHFDALAEFVLTRAMADWSHITASRSPIELTIQLPMVALESKQVIDRICLQLPDHPAIARLLVEISSLEISQDLTLARSVGKHFANYNVGLAIGDANADASWVEMTGVPIAVLNVGRNIVAGCATDRHKRSACGTVVRLAAGIAARTLAKGIETAPDLQAACDLGFDLGQGDLFAKPMDAGKFARTMLGRRSPGPPP